MEGDGHQARGLDHDSSSALPCLAGGPFESGGGANPVFENSIVGRAMPKTGRKECVYSALYTLFMKGGEGFVVGVLPGV